MIVQIGNDAETAKPVCVTTPELTESGELIPMALIWDGGTAALRKAFDGQNDEMLPRLKQGEHPLLDSVWWKLLEYDKRLRVLAEGYKALEDLGRLEIASKVMADIIEAIITARKFLEELKHG